jgi:hypothetical protein
VRADADAGSEAYPVQAIGAKRRQQVKQQVGDPPETRKRSSEQGVSKQNDDANDEQHDRGRDRGPRP